MTPGMVVDLLTGEMLSGPNKTLQALLETQQGLRRLVWLINKLSLAAQFVQGASPM